MPFCPDLHGFGLAKGVQISEVLLYLILSYDTVNNMCEPSIGIIRHEKIFKGGRTLRPRIFCRLSVYAKLLVVQISNLHKTLKSWTTSTHPKNHEERTNGSYFISG